MTPVVRVIQGAPCLVYEWPEPPTPHVTYAREHALVSRVWEASEGRRWDVVPFHAWERDLFVAGARLSLAARVELLSEGHGWDVVVIGYAERGNVPAMAVELVLEGAGYECQRAAEGVLEAVAREVAR